MDPLTGAGDPLTNPRPGPRRLRRRAEIPSARSAQRARTRERARNGDARLSRRDLRAVSRGARHPHAQLRARRSATSKRRSSTTGIKTTSRASDVRCPDGETGARMIAAIDAAKSAGDTLGGGSSFASTGCRPASAAIGSRISASTAFSPERSWACRPCARSRSVSAPTSRRRRVRTRTTSSRCRTGERRARQQSRGRHRGRHEQRPADRRARLRQTDSDADEGAAVGESARRTDAPATIVRSDVCVVPAAAIVGEAMVRLALDGAAAGEVRRRLDGRDARQSARAAATRRRASFARMKRHVALVGFMAAGKSTIGEACAQARLGFLSIPTRIVVREHGPISAIF